MNKYRTKKCENKRVENRFPSYPNNFRLVAKCDPAGVIRNYAFLGMNLARSFAATFQLCVSVFLVSNRKKDVSLDSEFVIFK